jgi:hypothetical protein
MSFEVHINPCDDQQVEMLRTYCLFVFACIVSPNAQEEVYEPNSLVQTSFAEFFLLCCKDFINSPDLTEEEVEQIKTIIGFLSTGNFDRIFGSSSIGGNRSCRRRGKYPRKGTKKKKRARTRRRRIQRGGENIKTIISKIGKAIIIMQMFGMLSVRSSQVMSMQDGIDKMLRLAEYVNLGVFTNMNGICGHIVMVVMSNMGLDEALKTLIDSDVVRNPAFKKYLKEMPEKEILDYLIPIHGSYVVNFNFFGLSPAESRASLFGSQFSLNDEYDSRTNGHSRLLQGMGSPLRVEPQFGGPRVVENVDIAGHGEKTNIFALHNGLIEIARRALPKDNPIEGDKFILFRIGFEGKSVEEPGHAFFMILFDSVEYGSRVAVMDFQLRGRWVSGTFEKRMPYIFALPLLEDQPNTVRSQLKNYGFPDKWINEAVSPRPFLPKSDGFLENFMENGGKIELTALKTSGLGLPNISTLSNEDRGKLTKFLETRSAFSLAGYYGSTTKDLMGYDGAADQPLTTIKELIASIVPFRKDEYGYKSKITEPVSFNTTYTPEEAEAVARMTPSYLTRLSDEFNHQPPFDKLLTTVGLALILWVIVKNIMKHGKKVYAKIPDFSNKRFHDVTDADI